MTPELQNQALSLLRCSLNHPAPQVWDGQWEAVAALIQQRSRLLVVQCTGWGKSLVYFLGKVLRTKNGYVVNHQQGSHLSLLPHAE